MREIAEVNGIHPAHFTFSQQDEVRFQKAYMGMVLIHGDLIETIPAITSTEGVEYKITVKIRKMASEISALLGLDENVKVLLFLFVPAGRGSVYESDGPRRSAGQGREHGRKAQRKPLR